MKVVKMRDGAKTDREQRGLLIKDSLVMESFEMTADLCKSIIHVLCHCSGTSPPCPPGALRAAKGELQAQTKYRQCVFFLFMPPVLKWKTIKQKGDRPMITF